MKQYFFILGREPELSVAEIWQVANFFNIQLSIISINTQYLIVSARGLDVNWWQNRLGGTIKIGEIVGTWKFEQGIITQELVKIIPPAKQIFFGFSWYGQAPRWMNALGLEIKKHIKGQGKVRYVVSREKILSSVVVQKNHLLPPVGYEFVFLPHDDQVIIGRTFTVQPFEEFSHRDFDRPARDTYVGMLPPKLARLMVNLSNPQENLLDPFCGSGTILQEAALLGVKNIVGSDSNADSVTRTKANIKWLKTNTPDLDFGYGIFHSSLESLKDCVKEKFSAIVCEPFLGKPMSGKENSAEINFIINDLVISYSRWLKLLPNFLKDNGRLVMVWPAIKLGQEFNFLPLAGVVKRSGLKFSDIIPAFLPKDWLTPGGTMLYFRPGQKIAREIVVMSHM